MPAERAACRPPCRPGVTWPLELLALDNATGVSPSWGLQVRVGNRITGSGLVFDSTAFGTLHAEPVKSRRTSRTGGQGAAARGARRTCGNRRLWRLRRKEPDWIASYRAWRNGLDDVRTGSVTGVRESCPRRGLYAFGGGGCTLEPRSRLVPAEARRFHDLREMYGVFRGFGPRGCPSEHVLLGAA